MIYDEGFEIKTDKLNLMAFSYYSTTDGGVINKYRTVYQIVPKNDDDE